MKKVSEKFDEYLKKQEARIAEEPTLAGQRAVALKLTWRGISRNPRVFLEKAWGQLWHFLRPDGLQLLLVLEHPQPLWRHVVLVLLDDALLVPTVVLFILFAAAGHPSRPRSLIPTSCGCCRSTASKTICFW